MKNYLVRYLIGRNQSDWEDILLVIQYSINTTIAIAHKLTPFELEFGTGASSIIDNSNERLILVETKEDIFYEHIN